MPLNFYSTGTVSIGSGATSIVGVGSNWLAPNARPGDTFVCGGYSTTITDVVDGLHLTIEMWPFGAIAPGSAYKILQVSPLRFSGGQAMADVSTLVAALNTDGFYWFVPPDATEPDPSFGEDGQFAFQSSTGKLWEKSGGTWNYLGIYKGLNIRGAYDNAASYVASDVVSYAGSSYVAIATTIGHAPPNATYWALLASKGDTGGIPLLPIVGWSTATAYVIGPPASYVSFGGSSYMCLVAHMSGAFATDLAAGKWGIVSQAGAPGGVNFATSPSGRLTLSSGVQVMKSSYAASTAVYLTPYGGNTGPVFDGTSFSPLVFAELTNILANSSVGNAGPSPVVPNAIYDLYLWSNGSTATLTRSDYWKKSAATTMTIASPCVVTWSGSDFADGTPITFATSGALPTGLTAGTTYFVKRTGAIGTPTATFNLAATVGGAAINTSGTQSGAHTGTAADNAGIVARASGGNCELQWINGIAVNKNTIANGPVAQRGTWYGTVKTNSSGTVDFIYGAMGVGGVAGVFNVFNAWNRENIGCRVIDTSASHTLVSATPRQLNGSAGNQVSFVVGLPVITLDASAQLSMFTAAVLFAFMKVGVQLDDPTTFDSNGICFAGSAVSIYQIATAISVFNPSLGSHILYINEAGDGTNSGNNFNQDGAACKSGLSFLMPM